MKFEILGFNQAEVLRYDLDLVDLTLLNYVCSMAASPSTEKIHGEDNLSYVWLFHKKVLFDLPILNIQEEALKKRFAKLVRLGLLKSVVQSNIDCGRKAFYAITSLCESLIFTQVYSNTLGENAKPVENNASVSKYTSDKNISNHISNNNTNKQQVLFNTNKEVLEVRKNERTQWFVDTYNSICVSLPKCQRLNAKRSKAISRVLKNYSEEEILTAFNNLESSDFCKGKNDSGWKADIDFLLKEDKFDRVLEGRYNSKRRCNAEEISSTGKKYRVSDEEKEEMRKAVERGELKEY
jgi:hypothetical protein